jgi:transcriptional regulator with XRE-family HTH domain
MVTVKSTGGPMAELKLKQERLKRGWSLTYLCTITGIAPPALSEIERGLRVVYSGWKRRIAQAFNMPEDTLFAEVDDDRP